MPELGFFIKTLVTIFSSYRLQTYFGLIVYVIVTLLICGLLAAVSYLLSLSSLQDSEKKSEYECGFEPFDSATRLPFDVHFYLVGILFLIFDVEIALLFPWVLSLNSCGWFGFYLMISFIFLLSVGFLYEWKRGALIWPSRQRETAYSASVSVQLTGEYNPFLEQLLKTPEEYEDAKKYIYLSKEQVNYGRKLINELFGIPEPVFVPPTDMLHSVNAEITKLTHNILKGLLKTTNAEIRNLFFPLLPEIALTIMILFIVTSTAFSLDKKHVKKLIALETLNALLVGLFFVFLLLEIELLQNISTIMYNGYATTNMFTTSLKMLIAISVFFVLHSSYNYLETHEKDLMEYPVVVALTFLFMLLLVSAHHLVSAFLCIVGFSLNLYVLILFDAPEAVAREAGIKYYYLSTFSSGLILYGIFLLFLILKTGNFRELNQILSHNEHFLSNGLVEAGISLILIGIFFKLSAFPGHLWAAEVYEGSPDVITAFFMLPVKITVLTFLIQLLSTALEPAREIWQPLLAFGAIFSMLWGCFAAVFEKKTKRFLAYASINQIGFLFIGICSASLEGFRATIIYLFIYTAMNVGFLTIFLNTFLPKGTSLIYLTDFRGLGLENWLINWALAISMLSMAGIPPLAGFFGKFYLILHAQEQQLYAVVIVALVTSLVSAYYYLRIIKIIWFESYATARRVTCKFLWGHYVNLFIVETLLFIFIITATIIVNKSDELILQLVV